MVITQTPFRISFFGGGTDYPRWYLEHGGRVLSTTIDKYCYISCRSLPPFFLHNLRLVYSKIETVNNAADLEHPAARAVLMWANASDTGLEIHHDSDLPARSGIASSSAFTVGLTLAVKTFQGFVCNKTQLAEYAINIEQKLIGEFVGSQDQFAVSHGGFNLIEFKRDGSILVSPALVSDARKSELSSYLMLFFTGQSRIASHIAKSQIENIGKNKSELMRMMEMVDEAATILATEDMPISKFGQLLHESWMIKKSLSDSISNTDLDNAYCRALEAGAIGGKLLGAGGGGFMLFFVNPEKHDDVKSALSGYVHVPFDFESLGSRVIVNKSLHSN